MRKLSWSAYARCKSGEIIPRTVMFMSMARSRCLPLSDFPLEGGGLRLCLGDQAPGLVECVDDSSKGPFGIGERLRVLELGLDNGSHGRRSEIVSQSDRRD